MICSANQWTGFYMITAAVVKGLNLMHCPKTEGPTIRVKALHWKWMVAYANLSGQSTGRNPLRGLQLESDGKSN